MSVCTVCHKPVTLTQPYARPEDVIDGHRECVAKHHKLLTDALDFIEANEWADGGQPSGYCLDCGAPESAQHSEHCAWLGLMRRSGRRA